ncbi:hypothetical protein OAM67_00965 [bacterium]|nr:hypothetical protein [bacterium]
MTSVRVKIVSADTHHIADAHEIKVRLQPCTPAFANSLRRIMMTEIQTWAIDKVLVRKNNTNMQDELLAHRIGLVPVLVPQTFTRKKVKFRAHVRCGSKLPFVDLKNADFQTETVGATLGQGKIGLCRLAPNQEIDIQAIAKKGCGMQNAKWSPVTCATFDEASDYETTRAIHVCIETVDSCKAINILRAACQNLVSKTETYLSEL